MPAACWSASLAQLVATEKKTMGAESMALGSLITAGSGLIGVVLAKCRCVYRRSEEGVCLPACGFSDKPLEPDHNSLDIHHDRIEDVEIIIVSKKTE